jgi:hypothetical protein
MAEKRISLTTDHANQRAIEVGPKSMGYVAPVDRAGAGVVPLQLALSACDRFFLQDRVKATVGLSTSAAALASIPPVIEPTFFHGEALSW